MDKAETKEVKEKQKEKNTTAKKKKKPGKKAPAKNNGHKAKSKQNTTSKQDTSGRKQKLQELSIRDKLTIKQTAYIDYLTNPENKETFGNQTRAYMAAYGTDYDCSRSNASNLMAKSNISNAVSTILNELDMGPKVRLKIVADIAKGKTRQTVKTTGTTYDDQGKAHEYSNTVERDPSSADRLKAIDLIAKIDGTYDRNRAMGDAMSSDMRALIMRHRREMEGDK